MPHSMPALSVGTEPQSVQNARRWVATACTSIGRPDVVECAEVGVSELVTNALLHADTPIQVRLRGTRDNPRVEVRDSSTDVPALPANAPMIDDDDLEGLLLTFGRGLSIVSRAAEAWGVDIEDDGKVVWFSPAADLSEVSGPEPTISYVTPPVAVPDLDPDGGVEVLLADVPVRAMVGFQHHFSELRREVRLLAFADDAQFPLADDLARVFDLADQPLTYTFDDEPLLAARRRGLELIDLRVRVAEAVQGDVERLIELLDLTDDFCRDEKLLSLARTPEQRDFQNWFLHELERQARGEQPSAWTDHPSYDGRHSSAS